MQIRTIFTAIPSRPEGRWPSSRTLGQVVVDAAASRASDVHRAMFVSERERARRAMLLRTAKPCGPDTRCLCQVMRRRNQPDRVSISLNPLATVTRRIRRRGERGISRKAIAQGTSECSACTCMLVCVSLCAYCTRDRGCSKHPAFPAPSFFEGQGSCKPSGS